MQAAPPATEAVITLDQVVTRFGDHVVHNGVSLQVQRAEIFAVIGGSGTGKSTLLREMILLQTPTQGTIKVLGVPLSGISDGAALALRQRWGVLFQHGGLFGALTVLENIGLPLREHTDLGSALIDEIAYWKLSMAGLKPEVANQYPSELSGGMMKRASLARALALDPELLFLDEPAAGLNPKETQEVDALVRRIADAGVTVVLVEHDMKMVMNLSERILVLDYGKKLAEGNRDEIRRNPDVIAAYLGAHA